MAERFQLVRTLVVDDGAFGVLQAPELPGFAVFTLERTFDQAGRAQLVKIPPGLYTCRSTWFYRGGYDTYEVERVPGASRILFHKGNVERDSEGCVLVGRRRGELAGVPAVLESGLAFDELMRRTGGRETFELEVLEVPKW